MKKLLRQLTKITDLTILFATIFVFLAYITAEGIPESAIDSVRTNTQTIASSLATAETQAANASAKIQESNLISNGLRSSIRELEGEVTRITEEVTRITEEANLIDAVTDQTRIDELNAEIGQLNAELTNNESEINQLNTELTNNESEIRIAQTTLEASNQNVQTLRVTLTLAQQEVADLEAALESSRAIPWIQPVRQNTDRLIDAAGFDGFIAGFAALIFCLVVKRRRDWFDRMFGFYFK